MLICLIFKQYTCHDASSLSNHPRVIPLIAFVSSLHFFSPSWRTIRVQVEGCKIDENRMNILPGKTNHASLRWSRAQGRLLAKTSQWYRHRGGSHADIRESIESVAAQKGRERDKTKEVAWNLYRRGTASIGWAQSPEPEWLHGKKDLDSRLSSSGWLPLCPNQPPTAKNLIRCHNYIQWCSTPPPDSPSSFPCWSFSLLIEFWLHFLKNCALVYVEDSLDTPLSFSLSLSHTNSTKSFVQAL